MKVNFLFILLVVVGFNLNAQFNVYNVHSPYSRYGVGKLAFAGDVQTIGLGKTTIGYRSNNIINSANPATYTSQDTMSFILNFSISNNYTQLASNENSEERYKFLFNNISIGFPLSNRLKTSIGIKPYSNVGYNIQKDYEYEDFGTFHNRLLGYGGITNFYIGSAVELFDHLSIGANMSYLFGSITQETTLANSSGLIFDTDYTDKYYMKGAMLNLGFQYYTNLSDNFNLTLGVIYDLNKKLKASNDIIHNNNTAEGTSSISDSLYHSLDNEIDLTIPQKVGAGFMIQYKEKISLIFDYSQQNWSKTTFRNINNNSLTNSNSLNLGIEFIPNKYSFKKYSDHIRYRIGAYNTNTCLNLNNEQVVEKGITVGLGLPLMNGKSTFNISFNMGTLGNMDNSLIQENFYNLAFNLTLYDFWFIKRKFD